MPTSFAGLSLLLLARNPPEYPYKTYTVKTPAFFVSDNVVKIHSKIYGELRKYKYCRNKST